MRVVFTHADLFLWLSDWRLTANRGEVAVMESEVEVPGREAGAVGEDQSSSSPTPFSNRGPQKWWWRREVGFSCLFFTFWRELVFIRHLKVPGLALFHTGGYENERDAPSDGPSPIINIKKEKRETEEETKEILRNLERDNVSHSPLCWNAVFSGFCECNSIQCDFFSS